MTSTHGAHARRFHIAGAAPLDAANPLTQHGRYRLRHRHRVAARSGPHPRAVWPLGGAEPLPDAALLAGWLGQTIIALVTGYTRPGDRVLLLPPPPASGGPRGRITSHSGDPYAGLCEAVWAITRLGRTADSPDTVAGHPTDATHSGGQSESGPGLRRLGLRRPTGPDTDSPGGVRAVTSRFALIITAVHPQTSTRASNGANWWTRTAWRDLMTDRATLAIITHSDYSGDRLLDPVPVLVNTMRSQSLGWHDHIAVLNASTAAVDCDGNGPTAEPSGPSEMTTPDRAIPIRRTHHDLLLFAPQPQPDHLPNAPVSSTAEWLREGKTSDD